METREKAVFNTPWSLLIVVLAPVVLLAPFMNKAFHIDDTVFLWAAKHIQSYPLDFYGFMANWYGFEMPMSQINQNPPLTSYYIALVASLFGWSEPALHAAFLLPAIGLCTGTFSLARHLSPAPLVASLITAVSPVFLVSSTNVMSDTTMVAFYVWAAALWVQGFKQKSSFCLCCAGILIALASLTKYFGITMAPLLLIYSLVHQRRVGVWLIYLVLPVLVLLGYEWCTHSLYGQGLFSNAIIYAFQQSVTSGSSLLSKTFTGLSFTGGSLAGILFFMPFLWYRRTWAVWALFLGIIATALMLMNAVGPLQLITAEGIRWSILLQFALFIVVGIQVLLLAAIDVQKNRDAASVLLFLWVWGVVLFASYFNWTINARVVFPLLPAAAILIMRRLCQRRDYFAHHSDLRVLIPLTAAACVALAVTWADFTLANCQRSAASLLHEKLTVYPKTHWFEGHWGFQYYMESSGAKALDYKKSTLNKDDIVIIPSNNSNLRLLPKDKFQQIEVLSLMPCRWLATLHKSLGAGFYWDAKGPLPFVFGVTAPEQYFVYLYHAGVVSGAFK